MYCKIFTFAGLYGVAYIATYVGFATLMPPQTIVCDGMIHSHFSGSPSTRVFQNVHAEDILYCMRTPCMLPCRIFKWLSTLVICCPAPAVLAQVGASAPQASAPPGEPKDPETQKNFA